MAQDPTVVLAFTLWRDELTDEQWEEASRSLVKCAFRLMPDLDTSAHVVQVWGRSYRDEKSKVEPLNATSAQFHGRVFRDVIEDYLRESGRHGVYVTPKSENHLSHPDWAMVWFESRVAAEVAASRATEHSGIARTKNRYALRVRAQILSQVAKEVKPNQVLSDQIQVLFLFKVQPIPTGIRPEQVIEWAGSFGWKIKVIKKLGRDAYLIGTAVQPPHPHLIFNGVVVLIKQVNNKKDQTNESALVAGPRQLPAVQASSAAPLPALSGDPWARWAANHPPPSGVAQGAGSMASIEGPMATKFAAIEQRMSKYESDMQALVTDCKTVATEVHNQHTKLQGVSQQLGGLETQVAQVHQHMNQTVEQAIQRGMAAQEKKLDSKFDQILKLLSNAPKRKTAGDEDDDQPMESPTK
eukprot:Skav217602  [mRNA]  locus=scaffold3512:236043:237275:- [translate_table: standard]